MKILDFCWTTFGNKITYWKKWLSRLRVKKDKNSSADEWSIQAANLPATAVLTWLFWKIWLQHKKCWINNDTLCNKQWYKIICSCYWGFSSQQNATISWHNGEWSRKSKITFPLLATIRMILLILSPKYISHIDGLVQEKRNSSSLAMELHLSCINPSILCITISGNNNLQWK